MKSKLKPKKPPTMKQMRTNAELLSDSILDIAKAYDKILKKHGIKDMEWKSKRFYLRNICGYLIYKGIYEHLSDCNKQNIETNTNEEEIALLLATTLSTAQRAIEQNIGYDINIIREDINFHIRSNFTIDVKDGSLDKNLKQYSHENGKINDDPS